MVSILSLAAGCGEVLSFAVLGAEGFPWEAGVDDMVYIVALCTVVNAETDKHTGVDEFLVILWRQLLFHHYDENNAIAKFYRTWGHPNPQILGF